MTVSLHTYATFFPLLQMEGETHLAFPSLFWGGKKQRQRDFFPLFLFLKNYTFGFLLFSERETANVPLQRRKGERRERESQSALLEFTANLKRRMSPVHKFGGGGCETLQSTRPMWHQIYILTPKKGGGKKKKAKKSFFLPCFCTIFRFSLQNSLEHIAFLALAGTSIVWQ